EVQEMLLGFVRIVPDALGTRRVAAYSRAQHFCAHDALNRMKARTSRSPLVLAVPRKSRAQCFSEQPSMRITEPSQHGPRGRESKRFDKFFSEQSQRGRIEQKHALARESDDPAPLGEVQ